jgi:hypothetical protein
MSGKKSIEVAGDLTLHVQKYSASNEDVWFEYIEHQADHWYSDDTTEADINMDKAIEIIEFLEDCFGIKEYRERLLREKIEKELSQ